MMIPLFGEPEEIEKAPVNERHDEGTGNHRCLPERRFLGALRVRDRPDGSGKIARKKQRSDDINLGEERK